MATNILLQSILEKRDDSQVAGLSRFFKTGPGQYGEGDKFLGIKVPVTREVVSKVWDKVSISDIDECIANEYHEVRLASLLCLVKIFQKSKKNPARQKEIYDYYLSKTQYVNNWDLVDLSCYEIVGSYLLDKEDRSILYDLATSGKTIWEQRIGIVSTMSLIRSGQLDDIYAIADIFLSKPAPLHDLLQKAVGWLLREAGKRDEDRLKEYLSKHCKTMPRTMLRYAIEKLSSEDKKVFMGK